MLYWVGSKLSSWIFFLDIKQEDILIWWHHMLLSLVGNKSQAVIDWFHSASWLLLIWRLRFCILRHKSILWKTIGFIRGNSSLRFCFLYSNLLHEPSSAFKKNKSESQIEISFLSYSLNIFTICFQADYLELSYEDLKFEIKDLRKSLFKNLYTHGCLFLLSLSQIPVAGIEKSLDFHQELICPDKGLCRW